MALTNHAHGDEDGDLVDRVHHCLCKEGERTFCEEKCHQLFATQTHGLDVIYNLPTFMGTF